MRNVLLALALASITLLTGCAGSQVLPVITTGSPSPATVSSVQATAIQICAFEPTAATVARMVSGSSIVTTADAIAQAICKAVTTNVQAEGNVPGRYVPSVRADDGTLVIVKGKFKK